jgi:hypothetical protein
MKAESQGNFFALPSTIAGERKTPENRTVRAPENGNRFSGR